MCLADDRPVRRSPDVQQNVVHARVRVSLDPISHHFEVKGGFTLTQGCCSASAALILLAGSTIRHFLIRSLASAEMVSQSGAGNSKSPARI